MAPCRALTQALFDVDIDYNVEILHAGYSQLASAPAAMIPTVTYVGMVVARDMGARSFLPPAMVIGGSLLLVFAGSYIVSLVPKVMFAALLVASGLNLLSDHLKSAYTDLTHKEFALVVLHIGLTATLGMLSAVVLGMLFTATIFIVQYSSVSGVLQSATSLLERSKVTRTIAEQDILEQYGATVLIIHLHGMIFFGSANSVVEEVKAHLATLAELQLPLRFLLLDFDRCSAIDSSAVNVLFSTRRQIKDAGIIFACASTDILSMLSRGSGSDRDFEHFTTLDLALEQCENRLLQRHMVETGGAINDHSPVMLNRHGGMFGGATKYSMDDHDVPLRTIDERNPMADDSPSNPSSDMEHEMWASSSRSAPAAHAFAPSTADVEAANYHKHPKQTFRKSPPRRRLSSERLPNPFLGPVHWSSSPAAANSTREYRDRPGPLNAALHVGSGAVAAASEFGDMSNAHGSYGSDGSSDSSSGGVGLATIYSPEQARAELRPDHLEKMRGRFTEAMRASYGAKDLDELFDHMDIMLIPPNLTVVSSHNPGTELSGPGDGTAPPYLYILDRGHISAYATLGTDITMGGADPAASGSGYSGGGGGGGGGAAGSSAGSGGSYGSSGGNDDIHSAKGEQNNPRHRLAKYGAGAILGVAAFVTPDDMPGLNIMPTAAISDTYCQLLRLPRSRCDELEQLKPALIFRLYRLLVLISERRLQDHRMRVVASEAFKINVLPSTNFQRMLAGGSQSLSTSADQLQQVPGTSGGLSASIGAMPPAGAPLADGGGHSASTAGTHGWSDGRDGGGGSRSNGSERIDSAGTGQAASYAAMHSGGSDAAPYGAGGNGSTSNREPGAGAGAPGPAPAYGHEVAPATSPLDRRSEQHASPALALFSSTSKDRSEGAMPLSQTYPGREPLPVASLQSFQSAMLAEVIETRDGEARRDEELNEGNDGEPGLKPGHQAPDAERPKERESFGDFLWPKAGRSA